MTFTSRNRLGLKSEITVRFFVSTLRGLSDRIVSKYRFQIIKIVIGCAIFRYLDYIQALYLDTVL